MQVPQDEERQTDDGIQYEPPEESVEEFASEQLSEQMQAMRLDTGVPGHVLPYDLRTAPQPHAHSHRLSEGQEFYPNKKWNCPDPEVCCNPPEPAPEEIPACIQKKDYYDMEGNRNISSANCHKFY